MILQRESRPNVALKVNSLIIKKSARVISLGLTTGNHLTFEEHTNFRCQTANYKVHALLRIKKYLALVKVKVLCFAFINKPFNYAMIWIFCRQKIYAKLENLHHGVFKIVFNHYASCHDFLTFNNEVSLHLKH